MPPTPRDDAEAFQLPKLPAPHKEFVRHVSEHHAAINDIVAPYKDFENKLREGFARHPHHPAVQDPNVNVVPVFVEDLNGLLRIRARRLDDGGLNQEYMMPLKPIDRKATGTPAVVDSFREFKKNFDLFSESSLVDLDWSNVVAAGSSVVTPLIPVPHPYNSSKKSLRAYYHQKLAPSSDVDLFIWGLDEVAAIEKIKQIETSIRNATLEEVTTIRTKNAITIVSQYPMRHVQIVLRLYKSISEILTGFDVDCSCFAYDGNQVYGTPRALTAFMTQTNTVDLTRRSPSYESRLSKYAQRGFEIHWPGLDRSRIDPTIFERSFARTTGLARLLVLERLPRSDDRENYLAERRRERGRPELNRHGWYSHRLAGNLKDSDPNDVAEWVYEDNYSNYHTFTVPYGPKYHARRIEKILYTKDLLLNAEWNAKKDRAFSLHRHPCFIGDVDSVMHDCCGLCPKPTNDEERKIAKEESKIFVFGELGFMKDDPGRQAIGSFNPLTSDDWTDMAYIGGTSELCHRICEGDLAYVENWCSRADSKVNRRDHTGRTPLHLAAQASSPDIVKCLVKKGARIVARLVDGMTALHLAAARGNSEIVQILLEKSEANEEEEAERKEKRKGHKIGNKNDSDTRVINTDATVCQGDSFEEEDIVDVASDASDESTTMTQGSFVKIKDKSAMGGEALPEDETSDDPDVYDVNVIAWDAPVSALHLAIIGGHIDVVKTLISTFGADVLLPVKILDSGSRDPEAAIMTLVLAAQLSGPESLNVAQTLLSLGASSAQADMNRISALHYVVAKQSIPVLDACFRCDEPAAKRALDHLVVKSTYSPQPDSPLTTALKTENTDLVNRLLDLGAKPTIDLDDFVSAFSSAVTSGQGWRYEELDITEKFKQNTMQPVLIAVENDLPGVVYKLLERGVDVNTINPEAHRLLAKHKGNKETDLSSKEKSLLDHVNTKIWLLRETAEEDLGILEPVELREDERNPEGLMPGTYEHWQRSKEIQIAINMISEWHEKRAERISQHENSEGRKKKRESLSQLRAAFKDLRQHLLKVGALTMKQLYPDIPPLPKIYKQTSAPSKSFNAKASFKVPHCTEKVRQGYLQLFQAAWEGDANKIRELTLASWGPEGKNSPLQIAVQDKQGFSPFAIALFRNHTDVAKLILTITTAQFKGVDEDPQRRRYTMLEDEYGDDNSDDEDGGLAITSKLVDENFTVDDITALPKSVASTVSVSTTLGWCAEIWMLFDKPESIAAGELGYNVSGFKLPTKYNQDSMDFLKKSFEYRKGSQFSLARYALAKKDVYLLKYLLNCSREASTATKKDDAHPFPGFYSSDFYFALEKGNLEAVAEMVKTGGAELPLDSMVKRSGVKAIEKPKYYPGLSIGGRKMTKWAQPRGGSGYNIPNDTTPPLLQAVYQGGIAATEWFLSDTPLRLYKEFGSNNGGDARLKALAKADGGLDQAVASWLRQRSNLALHVAVLSQAKKEQSLEVLKYLIDTLPESTETKSNSGHTPLSLAFNRRRVDAAKALIAAGADQTTRDLKGRNIVHLALRGMHDMTGEDPAKARALFDLIDKRVRQTLFLERCQDRPGGATPLARWLWQSYESGRRFRRHRRPAERSSALFQTILEYSGGEDLAMMDASGQFPLHQAVKTEQHKIVALVLNHDPALLWQENAMGQTPLELAEALYIRHCTLENPDISKKPCTPLQARDPHTFMDNYDHSTANIDAVVLTWRACQESAAVHPRVRKLISLSEAREVAKRLTEPAGSGDRMAGQGQDEDEGEDGDEGQDGDGDGDSDEGKCKDEVHRWGYIYD